MSVGLTLLDGSADVVAHAAPRPVHPVIEALRRRLMPLRPGFRLTWWEDGLCLAPDRGEGVTMVLQTGAFAIDMVVNEVSLDTGSIEEAYSLLLKGMDGTLRVRKDMRRGRVVGAAVEVLGHDGCWRAIAGYTGASPPTGGACAVAYARNGRAT